VSDVVVIGAGVIGASCAVHLARAGFRVRIVERASGPTTGSTWRATGGFRAQFATAVDVRLSLLARGKLLAFRDDTGVDPEFRQVGYLFLASDLAPLREAQAVQHASGLTEARLVAPDDIRAIHPHASLAGIEGGAFCPTDGVMRPTAIQRGYLELAARLGVDVRWGEAVTALPRDGERIVEVVTPLGRYAAGLVVNAAGAWAAPVAHLAGVDAPVVPLRRQVAVTMPTDAIAPSLPLTIWLADGFHLRERDGRVLLLRPTPNDGDPWNDRVDPAWLDDIARLAGERVPVLRDVPLDRERAWAGLYEMSPDHHAIVGFALGCPNLMLVNGSSGHGVMHAPALGQLVAELATGVPTAIDIHALRPSRFSEGEAVSGPSLL
jgi:sarcosine oxidase, subunit beta